MGLYDGKFLASPPIEYNRIYLESHDRGLVGVDILEKPELNNNYEKIILILPGMTGKSPDPYIKRIVRQAFDRNYLAAVITYRGYAGLEVSKNSRRLSMCTYTDLELVLQYLEEKYGSNKT